MTVPSHRRRESLPVAGGVTRTPIPATGAGVPAEVNRVASPTTKAGRIAAIIEVAGQLDLANPGHVTDDSKPDVTALEGLLGWRPSAVDRDAAWAEINGKQES
jgi:hypothetical protein